MARTGNLLAAGKAVGVNPTAAARRIADLETAPGVRLFDRLQQGYRLTEVDAAFPPQPRGWRPRPRASATCWRPRS